MSEVIHHFLVRYLKFQAEHLTPESVDTIIKESIRHKIMSLFSAEMKDKLNPAGTESAVEEDDTDKENDAERLWQANRRTRPSNPKSRNDCSLRRACNAGRLLSRLPSVQDITLQLKTYNNEPHWDALLWGMSKKRCSKIFCKRQRSPKGSRHHWDAPEKRHHRKNTPSTRSPRFRYDENDDLTTIYPV
ncbi:uncharacterized protein CEXT_732301 [Caerostris extrusa]|uniref:Uncharacterized protein n=1 Tax=Caerostris extrusa TaxID=172846 RepID=A0AAV4Y7J7_CAEEX|nr:uncharacterized protein CEXT_732301 [Caerostris extrusa]